MRLCFLPTLNAIKKQNILPLSPFALLPTPPFFLLVPQGCSCCVCCCTITGLPGLLPHLRAAVPTPSCTLRAEECSSDLCDVRAQGEGKSPAGCVQPLLAVPGCCGPSRLWDGMELSQATFLVRSQHHSVLRAPHKAELHRGLLLWVTSLRSANFLTRVVWGLMESA